MASGNAEPELLERYAKTQKELENQMSVWELASEEYENLK